jgi:hypothetical protein
LEAISSATARQARVAKVVCERVGQVGVTAGGSSEPPTGPRVEKRVTESLKGFRRRAFPTTGRHVPPCRYRPSCLSGVPTRL